MTVAAGATSATFAITTNPVTTVTAVNITATYNGAAKIVTLVVNPPLASVTLTPASVTGGAASTGTVTLATAAPAGGAVVTLTSSNINAATVPASVTVAGRRHQRHLRDHDQARDDGHGSDHHRHI